MNQTGDLRKVVWGPKKVGLGDGVVRVGVSVRLS